MGGQRMESSAAQEVQTLPIACNSPGCILINVPLEQVEGGRVPLHEILPRREDSAHPMTTARSQRMIRGEVEWLFIDMDKIPFLSSDDARDPRVEVQMIAKAHR